MRSTTPVRSCLGSPCSSPICMSTTSITSMGEPNTTVCHCCLACLLDLASEELERFLMHARIAGRDDAAAILRALPPPVRPVPPGPRQVGVHPAIVLRLRH